MKKVLNIFYEARIEYFVASYFTLLMIAIMCMNVVLRYGFNFAFGWGDEIVRYLNLYAAFFGISAGMKYGIHIGITAFVDTVIPKVVRKYVRLFAELVLLVFCLTIVYCGFILTYKQFMMHQISPALQIPMYIMYAVIPVGMIFTSIQCLIKIFGIKDWKNDAEQPLAQE